MITVGLPTWRNDRILWFALEGLARQQCDVPWELIVMECVSNNKSTLNSYSKALKKAGCVNIKYAHMTKRIPLLIKWKAIANNATGTCFCLQGSDDYPQPDRNQKAWDAISKGHDWFHSQYFYQYSLNYNKMLLYNRDTLLNDARVGYNNSMLTADVRSVKDTWQLKGIDNYLYFNIMPKNIFYDRTGGEGGLSTDGLNSLSKSRHLFYKKACPPFVNTSKGIHDIGLPDSVIKKLLAIKL